MMTNNFLDFFWSHILKRGPDECWEWTGHVSIYGYGTYNGLVELLGTNRCSRQAYILTKGEIPPDFRCFIGVTTGSAVTQNTSD